MKEKLTLVIFKDHLSSRTLHIPFNWIKKVSVAVLSVIILALLTSLLMIINYQKMAQSPAADSSRRATELEKQLSDLQASYDSLKSQTQPSSSGTVLQAAGGYFAALPQNAMRASLPPRDSLAFQLEPFKIQWKGNQLSFNTAIEYTKDDGGNQQGHFVILARGPQSLMAYPDGAFQPAGSEILVRPDSGEYFSVSRYREIKATFGPYQNRSDLQSIELLIFDSSKQLIFVERVGIIGLKGAPEKNTEKSEKKELKIEQPSPSQVSPVNEPVGVPNEEN